MLFFSSTELGNNARNRSQTDDCHTRLGCSYILSMVGCSGLYLKNNTEEKAKEQYDGDDGTAGLRRE